MPPCGAWIFVLTPPGLTSWAKLCRPSRGLGPTDFQCRSNGGEKSRSLDFAREYNLFLDSADKSAFPT